MARPHPNPHAQYFLCRMFVRPLQRGVPSGNLRLPLRALHVLRIYVHPLCTMLPQTIRSPFVHAEHDLCMVPATSGQCCSACDQGLGVWQYRCGFCQLKLHIACASGAGEQEQGGAVATTCSSITTTGGAQQSNGAAIDVGRPPIRRRVVAKSLLKTSFRHAIDAATGVLSSPVLDVLAAGCWN